MGLNGRRADNLKRTLIDFCFSYSKEVAGEEQENEKEVVAVEDDGREAEDVSMGVSVSVPPL